MHQSYGTAMRHRQVEAFRAVMIGGTVTAAAKRLGISQPSVSRLLSDLEEALELALFERRPGGRISPTPEAIRFYAEVEQSAMCLDVLPLAVGRFLDQHPQVSVMLHARSSREVVEWVMTQRCELGLASPPFDVRGVTGDLLIKSPCVCALPKGHRLASRDAITPLDLVDEHLVIMTSFFTRHEIEAAFLATGVPMRPRIETPLSIVACRHVELGLGISIIEAFTARYCAGRDIVVRPFLPEVPFILGVLAPEGGRRSVAARKFLDVLVDTFAHLDLPGGARIETAAFEPRP
jgi:DNA-binding transcriptional LysR family regulator